MGKEWGGIVTNKRNWHFEWTGQNFVVATVSEQDWSNMQKCSGLGGSDAKFQDFFAIVTGLKTVRRKHVGCSDWLCIHPSSDCLLSDFLDANWT